MKTPCKNICVVDTETGLCIGCGRTRPEIAGWTGYSDAEREQVMALLPERVATLSRRKKRKGGARARRAQSAAPVINIDFGET